MKLDEEKEKKVMKELDLEEDEFIKMYHIKRLQEMKTQAEQYVSSIRLVSLALSCLRQLYI